VSAIDVLGWVAAAVSASLMIPQMIRVWTMVAAGEAPAGVSVATAWLSLAGGLLWAVWAVAAQSYPAGAPALVSVPVSAGTIIALRRQPASGARMIAAQVEIP